MGREGFLSVLKALAPKEIPRSWGILGREVKDHSGCSRQDEVE